MPLYLYKARDASGKLVRGTLEARGKEELVERLRKLGYLTTQVSETLPGISIESFFDRFRRVRLEDMTLFNIQLSNMINAGIGVLTNLTALSKQIENKRLQEAVANVARGVESGEGFSEALAKYPHVFAPIFVSMVKAGEASGKLDTILTRYSVFSEQQHELNQKVRSALFYPAILFFAGVAVILFIVSTIIPQFVEIFSKSGVRLPLLTMTLYHVGMGLRYYWIWILLLIAGTFIGGKFYVDTEKGRLWLDELKLRLPVIGRLYRKAALSRFARTLGTLVASGVPILESLDIVEEVVGNQVLARVVENLRHSVEKGEHIAESLKISEEFPPDIVQMIRVGEETGNLDGMLNKIADFYDLSLGYSIKRLTSLIEPVFLVIMGSIVAFIMASMLLPIFDMIHIIKH